MYHTLQQAPAKLFSRPRDDGRIEKFLDFFYKLCIRPLLKPMFDIPEHKGVTGACARADLMCTFISLHHRDPESRHYAHSFEGEDEPLSIFMRFAIHFCPATFFSQSFFYA